MKIRSLLMGAAFAIGALTAASAQASVFVDARDDIFLAGQTALPNPDFPAQSVPGDGAGFLPVALAVTAGEVLHLTATGLASCCSGADLTGPDGGVFSFEPGGASIPGYGFVGGYTGTAFALLGVFNVDGPSSTTWTPFVIGSSATITVPTGATKLYVGLPDSLGFDDVPGYYNDNTGGFTLSVPEPATWAMMMLGFGGLGVAMRGARRKSATATA